MDNKATFVKLNNFPSFDGHIESILIGCEDVKVSFQTWNVRAIVLIFRDVENLTLTHAVYGDIGDFTISDYNNDHSKYVFHDASSDEEVLCIISKSMEIYDTGSASDINSAVFDVGFDYIGNQKHPYN